MHCQYVWRYCCITKRTVKDEVCAILYAQRSFECLIFFRNGCNHWSQTEASIVGTKVQKRKEFITLRRSPWNSVEPKTTWRNWVKRTVCKRWWWWNGLWIPVECCCSAISWCTKKLEVGGQQVPVYFITLSSYKWDRPIKNSISPTSSYRKWHLITSGACKTFFL